MRGSGRQEHHPTSGWVKGAGRQGTETNTPMYIYQEADTLTVINGVDKILLTLWLFI